MSAAPGLDLQVMELLDLPRNTARSSINFMGCYAGVHALKTADAICQADKQAKVLIVCTELCTLHFQREPTMDNIASSLLFADGSAAADERLERVLTCDPGIGVARHADAGYPEAIATAESRGVRIPMRSTRPPSRGALRRPRAH